MDPQLDPMNDQKPNPKTPVVRGARACTVCRTAKMKCVGAEDGQKQCQRCKRANVECVFEKHRRGRKPGSKLSEASKMLRRLEKGLNSAKMKSQSSDTTSPYHTDDLRPAPNQDAAYSPIRTSDPPYSSSSTHFPKNELPPPNIPPYQPPDAYAPSSNGGSRPMDIDDEDEDPDRGEEAFFPAKLIRQENQRNSFFRTILNPNPEETPAAAPQRSNSFTPPQNTTPAPSGLSDPITAGIITDNDAKTLFDAIFLRLNPFVNLFDPALHTVAYVRSKCPFLFTTLIMAGCKFFKADKFKECQKLVNEYTVRAFAEAWKRVEVVQAFACLTYWKDPDDSRTWTYIGYACRMAVELGLNRYVANPAPGETEFQKLERRNRQRTYLVLFVHDRSLSMQTGRIWMLPEDDLIRNCSTWHTEAGPSIRPEDAVITAFVSLRRIAAETTDIFNSSKSSHSDINHDMVLKNCNARLNQWDEHWRIEMQKVGGEMFHHSFLSFFRLHVRLFLNSFGLQPSMVHGSGISPNVQALNACLTSAKQSLEIVSQDFHNIHVLRYGQDSITVMSAYSAVFLLKLLRTNLINIDSDIINLHEIHKLISETADSYQDASSSSNSPVSISASYHARFLRSLVANDIFKTRHVQPSHSMPIDPQLQGPTPIQTSPVQMYSPQGARMQEQPTHAHVHTHPNFHFPASPHLPAHPTAAVVPQEHVEYAHHPVQGRSPMTQSPPGGVVNPIHYPSSGPVSGAGNVGGNGNLSSGNHNHNGNGNGIGNGMSGMGNNGYAPAVPPHSSDLDAHYWKNMFIELGFGDTVDPNSMPVVGPTMVRGMPQYMEQQQQQPQHHHPQQQQHQQHHQQHEQHQHHHHHQQQQQNPMPHQQSHHIQNQMQYHMHAPSYGH